MSDLTVQDIKAMLLDKLDALVRELVPGVFVKDGRYQARCPWRGDKNAGSFSIYMRGAKAGGWNEYATGECGDVIDLVAFCRCGASGKPSREDRVAAIQWAKDWLGVSAADPAARKAAAERAKAARCALETKEAALQAREAEERRQKRMKALRLWSAARDWRGTPVEAYLRARGVDPHAIHWADGVRYIERLDYWARRAAGYGPAMVCAFRHPKSGFMGLHAVWLLPDGSGKASFDPPKLTLGSNRGAFMRLAAPGGADQRALAPIAFCEGPEDGASVAEACPDYEVRAVAGLSNLRNQIVPAGTPHVVVCADNDWGKPAAEAELAKGVAALRAQGVQVVVAHSHHGKDFNDLRRKA